MPLPRNPFHTLYVTERVGEVDFPSLFSPVLIASVLPLFQPGNVVIRGTQGTGKSMLLALLQTDIRLSYAKSNHDSYPVPEDLRRFIGASINLSTSRAWHISERAFGDPASDTVQRSQGVFADFLNCWILRDLFISIRTLHTGLSNDARHEIGLVGTTHRIDTAIAQFSRDDVCAGIFEACHGIDAAIDQLGRRLRVILNLLNHAPDEFPDQIRRSLTVIGEPIAHAVQILRKLDAITARTEVIVTIDQFEELLGLESTADPSRKNGRFREVIDRLLSTRDRFVSYRVGARPYALLGMDSSEQLRDYMVIDLDEILRKKEHSKNLVFPRFAEDVLRRRLATAGYSIPPETNSIAYVFGKSPSATSRARSCAPNNPIRVIKFEPRWPSALRDHLMALAKEDVLSAKLGEAWVRQQQAAARRKDIKDIATSAQKNPWETIEKRWWKKERLPQAILQIASANKQRVPFFGSKDILSMSGENILAFASMCQQIWQCWILTLSDQTDETIQLPAPFEAMRQSEGIREASNIWRQKIVTAPKGNTLQRFIDTIGHRLNRQLTEDQSMSYPGANGFSLSDSDVKSDTEVAGWLSEASAQGFLLQRKHTPKTKSRGKSQKWYLHPIFSYYYELTVPHTKEPLYLRVADLRGWLEHDQVLGGRTSGERRKKRASNVNQGTLFGEDE